MGHALSVVAGLLVAAGAALTTVGVLGWRRRLPRNRFAGVRTVSSLRDDETFTAANLVGAPLTVAAGAVAGLGGLAALAAPTGTGGAVAVRPILVVLATVGAVVLTVVGGVLGDRAARRVPVRAFGGCAGACGSCGCAAADQPASTEQRAGAGEPEGTALSSGTDQANEGKRS